MTTTTTDTATPVETRTAGERIANAMGMFNRGMIEQGQLAEAIDAALKDYR